MERIGREGSSTIQETVSVSANKPITWPSDRYLKFPFSFLWILLISFIVFGQILTYPPGKLDEYNIIIVNIEFLKDIGNFGEACLTNPFFQRGGDFYRPVQNISLMLDAQMSGMEGWGYYLTNILLHAVACTLLFSLLTKLNCNRRTAFLLALIYLVHPLFVQTVAWAPSRGDMLITVFGLTSFLGFISYVRSGYVYQLIIHLLAAGLALFSKESAIVIPLVCYAWYFLLEKRAGSINRKLLWPLPFYLLIVILFFYIRETVVQTVVEPGQFGFLSLITNFRTIPELASKFFIPAGLTPLPAFSWFFTLAGILLIGSLAGLAVRKGADAVRMMVFGLFWYMIFLGPALFYVNKYGHSSCDYMEHRGYLPLIGIVLVLGFFLTNFPKPDLQRRMRWILAGIIVLFGIYSFSYSRVYSNGERYYSHAVEQNASSAIAIFNRGVVRMYEKQDYRGAISDFDSSDKLMPGGYAQARLNKGYCLEQLQDYPAAYQQYQASARLNTSAFEPHLAMALLLDKHGEYSAALSAYDTVLMRAPGRALTWFRRAMLKYRVRDLQGALSDFDRSISLDSRRAEAFSNRGILKFELQDYPGAVADLTSAIAIDKSSAESYLNRGRIHYFMQQYGLACQDWLAAGSLGNEEARQLWEEYCR